MQEIIDENKHGEIEHLKFPSTADDEESPKYSLTERNDMFNMDTNRPLNCEMKD